MNATSVIIPVGGELPGIASVPTDRRLSNGSRPSKGKASGRFEVVNLFCDRTMKDLSGSEVRVWMLLWRDTRDGISRTGQTDLARRAGVNLKTVKRALAALIQRGLVVLVERGNFQRGPSIYRVVGWIPP